MELYEYDKENKIVKKVKIKTLDDLKKIKLNGRNLFLCQERFFGGLPDEFFVLTHLKPEEYEEMEEGNTSYVIAIDITKLV